MATKKKIYLVGGARPNFMKVAPLCRELKSYNHAFDVSIVHTGQHYDYNMSKVFFDELGIPEPDFFLGVGSGSHGYQTAEVLKSFEELAVRQRPDLVTVVGDVNSTLAAALAAAKLGIKVAHVEAGLRSFDMSMPEEINRVLTDRISDLLFVSEPSGVENLENEGADMSKVHLVGNVMIDTLVANLSKIRKAGTVEKLGLNEQDYAVVTIHRPSNVDSKEKFQRVISLLQLAAKNVNLIFPVHPRTSTSAAKFEIEDELASIKGMKIIKPLGYFDSMNLIDDAKFVMTDSGGIQEETTWLGVPCITLRPRTERPLTVDEGTNRTVDLNQAELSEALNNAMAFDRSTYKHPPLWDGKAAGRIVKVLN